MYMNWKSLVTVCIFPAFLMIVCLPAHVVAGQAELSSDIVEARKALSEDRYDDTIVLMEKRVDQNIEKEQSAEVRYLLAMALFHQTRIDINECRERQEIGSQLKPEQAEAMKRAEKYFLESTDLNPKGPKAAEGLYFAGVIEGYGCLNHFDEAERTLQRLVEEYPDSKHVEDARKRLKKQASHGAH